jgi:hypothetical protein
VLLLRTLFRKFHVTSITCKPSHPSDTLTPPPHANPTELYFNPKTKTKPSNRNKTNAKKKPQNCFQQKQNSRKRTSCTTWKIYDPQLSTTSPFKPKRRISPPLLLVSTQEEETNPKNNHSPKKKETNEKNR